MARVMIIEARHELARRLAERLNAVSTVDFCVLAPRFGEGRNGPSAVRDRSNEIDQHEIDAVVYSPRRSGCKKMAPDHSGAQQVFKSCTASRIAHIVVLSDAAVYGADYQNPGLIRESRPATTKRINSVAEKWRALEELAEQHLGDSTERTLTILRPTFNLIPGSRDFVNRLFRSRIAVRLPGYDPSIQLLSCDDLAAAVCCAIERGAAGVYNVAPDTVIPLRKALRLAGVCSVPVPHCIQSIVRKAAQPIGAAEPIDQMDYLRYSWTISNEKLKRELDFRPTSSSVEALAHFRNNGTPKRDIREERIPDKPFDSYGMDEQYIRAYSRTLFRFTERFYWQIEVQGLEHIPREGGAVLAGVHRGFMPFDGVMLVHLLAKYTGRIPRFLLHPGLVKFPFLATFLTKLGGIIACKDNADYVLSNGEILGIFPEGIRGAFRLYRDAYTIGKFGRNGFVKIALRHGVPIIPIAIVGPAEMFPIFAKVHWQWWRRKTEWPFFPITPTWPLLPLPLPSKWHVQVLPPIHVSERCRPATANDRTIASSIS